MEKLIIMSNFFKILLLERRQKASVCGKRFKMHKRAKFYLPSDHRMTLELLSLIGLSKSSFSSFPSSSFWLLQRIVFSTCGISEQLYFLYTILMSKLTSKQGSCRFQLMKFHDFSMTLHLFPGLKCATITLLFLETEVNI